VRLSISNYETLVANALRRALRNGEHEVVPRISDLDALVASTAGKIEIESMDDGREEQVLARVMQAAVFEVFRAAVKPERLGPLVTAFEDGLTVDTGDDLPASAYEALATDLIVLRDVADDLDVAPPAAGIASVAEFVLEGLHLTKRLNKDSFGGHAHYRSRG